MMTDTTFWCGGTIVVVRDALLQSKRSFGY